MADFQPTKRTYLISSHIALCNILRMQKAAHDTDTAIQQTRFDIANVCKELDQPYRETLSTGLPTTPPQPMDPSKLRMSTTCVCKHTLGSHSEHARFGVCHLCSDKHYNTRNDPTKRTHPTCTAFQVDPINNIPL